MFSALKRIIRSFHGQGRTTFPPGKRHRAVPQVETLETRCCPAVYRWVGPNTPTADHLWSNPANTNWQVFVPAPLVGGVWVQAGAGVYPGQAANDAVLFDNAAYGPATLNVPLFNSLGALEFAGWSNTLTVNFNLNVAGASGDFNLNDASTIQLANNTVLDLRGLSTAGGAATSNWTNGSILGGDNSVVFVESMLLRLSNMPPASALP